MANIKTGRKQAEQALKVSEEKFSRAFHSNPHPMSIVTMAEGRYLDVNDSYVQTFGFPREELLGRTAVETGILKDNNARSKILQLQKEEQALKNLEVELYTRSGQKIEALLSADKMEIGGQTCLLTVITDVTERKRMEEALRESQELYRAVLELGSRVGEATVLLQDDERGTGMHMYVSDVWCDITGYSREELLDVSMADLINPRDRDAAVARHAKRLGGEDIPGLIEISIIRKNGTEVPVEVTFAHSTYKGKSANVGFIRDVTKRKQAEEKQAELVQELQETLKEIRTLSGLLPICAWCKKLRDDEGYWKSVEQYIGERTKAEFTHGICPECNEKFQVEENRKLNSDTRMNQS